jgi:MoxR-like ATPase
VNEHELPHIRLQQVRIELQRTVVGQERMIDRLLTAVLAEGHCLLEGVPGLGKTLTLATLARVLGGTFSRIQFTADLIPADIVGTRIYRPTRETFDVEPGPILANIVLADEINRAPAKVQSALLEVMQERQVTVGGKTMPAPRPFLVVATQNPIESEGVYPLPEAQRDRFLMRVPVDYPTPAEEREIVNRFEDQAPRVSRLLDPDEVVALQAAARTIEMDEATMNYALRLVLATRDPKAHGLPELAGLLEYGASPRASLGVVRAARALALLRGRDRAVPQDVYDVAYDVLNLRLVLSYRALADGMTVDDVLVALLKKVWAPVVPMDWAGSPAVAPATASPQASAQPIWTPQPVAVTPAPGVPATVPPAPVAPAPLATLPAEPPVWVPSSQA